MKDVDKKEASDSTVNNDLIYKKTNKTRPAIGELSLASKSVQGTILLRRKVAEWDTKETFKGEVIEFPVHPLISAQEILAAQIPETKYAFPGLIPKGLTILAGKPKMGKSWFCLNLAASIAYGLEFLGQTPAKQEVLYFALEDNPTRIKQRLSAILPENFKAEAEDDNA